MYDYDEYINFLNNNLNDNVTNTKIDKHFLKILWSDIGYARKELNNVLKNKNYTFNEKYNVYSKINNDYFPEKYNEKIKNKTLNEYIFEVGNRKIKLSLYFDDLKSNYLMNCFKKIYMWLYIVSKYSLKKCSNTLKISIYLLNEKKILPYDDIKVLSINHINSAYASVCWIDGEIVIFRKEEWFKVFLHESFHAFGLDFSYHSNTLIKRDLLKIFNIKSTMNVFETYTETWATIWHISFLCYELNSKIQIDEFNNYFIYFLSLEQIHSLMQCTKILDFMRITYNDLINNTKEGLMKRRLYKEKTNVFNYYILKTNCLLNINEYFKFCSKYNINLLNFDSSTENLHAFSKLLIKFSISNETKKYLKNGEKLFRIKKNMDNFYLNRSLRMTISEL